MARRDAIAAAFRRVDAEPAIEDATVEAFARLAALLPMHADVVNVDQGTYPASIGEVVVIKAGVTVLLPAATPEAIGGMVRVVKLTDNSATVSTIRPAGDDTIDGGSPGLSVGAGRGSYTLIVALSGQWVIDGRTIELIEVGSEDPLYHVDRFENATDFTPVTVPGNWTLGGNFSCRRKCTMTGIAFYTALTTAHSVKVSLWLAAGTLLRSETQAVASSSTGIYRVPFANPYKVTASLVGEAYTVGVYETTGTDVVAHVVNAVSEPFGDGPSPAGVAYVAHSRMWSYSAGDARPATPASASTYPVDPIIEVN